ncbi:MAG: TolB family protein [Verrucomicrobiia bacterium]
MKYIGSIKLAIPILLALFNTVYKASPLNSLPAKPQIFPDYADITIPPNIAPLNFIINEKGSKYRVEYLVKDRIICEVKTSSPEIQISENKWKELLHNARGSEYVVKISVFSNEWINFCPITNRVANEEIDPWIVYRYLKPLYQFYYDMSIRQRNLETFNEKIVLPSWRFERGCLNCHTFLNHTPSAFAFHVRRGKEGNPMILCISNKVSTVDKTLGYISFHPSGKAIAFSLNKLSLFFHATGETRDVYDEDSTLGIYRIDKNTIESIPEISNPEDNQTWPCWSADGKYLFYCVAKKRPVKNYRDIKYSLARISYELEANKWGNPEILVPAEKTGLSVHQPRISPDSRFVLFAMSEYGNFPVYRLESDLYLLNIQSGDLKRLELISDSSDSWHCWSSNGRWILFSSKRMDGVFARPHISYFDTNAVSRKPFVVPQKDPKFYTLCIHTFNVPEFSKEQINITQKQLLEAIAGNTFVLKPYDKINKSKPAETSEHYGSKLEKRSEQ